MASASRDGVVSTAAVKYSSRVGFVASTVVVESVSRVGLVV